MADKKNGAAPGNSNVPGGMPETMVITDSEGKAHCYVRIDDDELTLLSAFEDAKESGSGFFEHIGLDPEASFEDFRAHYDKDGAVDIDRAAKDLFTYTPVEARLKELSNLLAAAELAEAQLADMEK